MYEFLISVTKVSVDNGGSLHGRKIQRGRTIENITNVRKHQYKDRNSKSNIALRYFDCYENLWNILFFLCTTFTAILFISVEYCGGLYVCIEWHSNYKSLSGFVAAPGTAPSLWWGSVWPRTPWGTSSWGTRSTSNTSKDDRRLQLLS